MTGVPAEEPLISALEGYHGPGLFIYARSGSHADHAQKVPGSIQPTSIGHQFCKTERVMSLQRVNLLTARIILKPRSA